MNTLPFEVAIYTDVRAEEALDGLDGFNFQAVSGGVTDTDRQRIRSDLLHQISPLWPSDHEATAHPDSCAYVVDGDRRYLARGRSTGRTNSGRPGNQLTETIVISSPAALTPYRPAQLFGAVNWTMRKASGPDMEVWSTPLTIHPEFEAVALKQMASRKEWTRAALPRFVTAMRLAAGHDATKLVIVGSDIGQVMQWIALGSLFLDSGAASDLEFRALVDDPWRARGTVVGVSPAFGDPPTEGANVLDLERCHAPVLEPEPGAVREVAWFLDESLAFDEVLSAIDASRRWSPVLGDQGASDAATMVNFGDEKVPARKAWRTAIAMTKAMPANGLESDVELYTDEIADAVVRYHPQTSEEFRQAGEALRCARDSGLDELANVLANQSLEALAGNLELTGLWATTVAQGTRRLEWPEADARESATNTMTEVLSRVADPALPEVFAALPMLGITPADDAVKVAARRLADLWVAQPNLGRASWRSWHRRELVLENTIDQLVERLRRGEGAALDAVSHGRWDFLDREAPRSDVGVWLDAGRLRRVRRAGRAEAIRREPILPTEVLGMVCQDADIPSDVDIFVACLEKASLPRVIEDRLARRVDDLLGERPYPKARLLRSYRPLVAKLSEVTGSEGWRKRLLELDKSHGIASEERRATTKVRRFTFGSKREK